MQLALPLHCNDIEYGGNDFILSCCNLEAYKLINAPERWRNLLLIGEEGSGKTHLAKIFQQKNEAWFINAIDIKDDMLPKKNAIVVENIHLLKDEVLLFHILNFAKENNTKMLMTTSEYPSFKLNDLKSRINSIYKTYIKKPSDNFLRVVLLKMLHDQQIGISKENLDFIISHCTRSFSYIKLFVEKIDKISLIKKCKLSIFLIKEVLQQMQYDTN